MTRYPTTVTHLAMEAPFRPHGLAQTLPEGYRFARQPTMPLADYRALYNAVGKPWRWVNRRHLSDRQLAALIHHPDTEVFVLSHHQQAVGFVELNFRKFPEVEIVFVGLIETEIGKGLGPTMLGLSLHHVMQREARRIIIQTCTLDHPAALHLYQKAGFAPCGRKQVTIIDRG